MWQPELLVIKTPRSPFALSSIAQARRKRKRDSPETILVLVLVLLVVVDEADNVRGGGDTRGQLYRRFRRNT